MTKVQGNQSSDLDRLERLELQDSSIENGELLAERVEKWRREKREVQKDDRADRVKWTWVVG